MKQKKSVGSNKLSVRKAATILLGCVMAAAAFSSVCVFSFMGKNEPVQKDTKAALISTDTDSDAVTERDGTFDTVEWRKAGIDEFELTEGKKETEAETTTEKEKKTKLENVKLVSDETVILREDKSDDSAAVATIGSGEAVDALVGYNDGWYKVSYAGAEGYVRAEFFTSFNIKAKKTADKTEEKPKAEAEEKTEEEPERTEYVVSFTPQEFEMFASVLEHEVGNCSEQSKIAVANVILNRVRSDSFPNSIYDVLTESDQFTAVFSYYDGSVVPSENTRECALRALSGEDNTNGAVYYYAPQYCCDPNTVSWFESMTLCYEVDGQRFFK